MFSSVFQYLGQWLPLRLQFKDPKTPKHIAPRKAVWLALSVDREVADLLAEAEDLQIEFARSVLRTSSTCQDKGDVVSLIVDTFKTAWRFTKLSDSRWVTFGPASQAVVVAALCGLEDFELSIRSKVGACPYGRFLEETEVHGAGRIVCRVSDGVLQLLMKRSTRPLSSTTKSGKLHPKNCPGLRLGRHCDALARRRDRGRSR